MLPRRSVPDRYPRLSAVLLVAILLYTIWQFGKLYWPVIRELTHG